MFLGRADDVDRNVNSGLWCSECGTEFTKAHGYPVACNFCWNLLSPQDRSQLKKATHREANRQANEELGRQRKKEKQARIARTVEND